MTDQSAAQNTTSQKQLDQLAKAWSRMIDCIAHDITSALFSIRSAHQILETTSPQLIKAYRAAVTHNVPDLPSINEKILALFESNLAPQINKGTMDITNFLALLNPYSTKIPSNAKDMEILSAKTIIDHLLTNYTFENDQERSLITVDCKHDFKFQGAEIFIENLLNHLLKNALEKISDANKGSINIRTEAQVDCNEIHVKDTATGMSEEKRSRIFDRFFSKRNGTIIPGLGFCRLAILQTNGDVLCYSSKGEYTEFVIKFPKI